MCCVSVSSPLSLKSFGGSHIIFAAPCTSSVPPTLTSPFLALISLPCQWTNSPNLQIIISNTLQWHALPWAHTTLIKFYINCCIHHYDVRKQLVHASAVQAYFKRLELLSAAPQATLTFFCPLLTSRVPNISTLMHELIAKCWRWSYKSEVVGDGGLTVIFILWKCIPRNSIQIEILQTISNLRQMNVLEFKAKNTFTLNFPLQALIYGAL